MFTIRPSPRRRIRGSARRPRRMGARTMVSKAARASSSPTSSTAPEAGKPALLTTAQGLRRPITRAQAAASRTSRTTVRTSTPAASAAERTWRALAVERTLPTESKPARASAIVVARPSPELAPVVRTKRFPAMGTVLIVESLTVDLDGPVHYASYGGTGDPLVLIHGLGGSHLNWMAVGDRLAIRHRVFAPDLLGFGLTPMRLGQRATLESNQALLEGFLERVVEGPATLVGNSMGGRLALQVAAHRPDLVRRLVLVDPAAPNPTLGGVDGLVIVFFAALLAPMAEPYLRRRSRRMGAEQIVRATLAVCCEDPHRVP